MIFLPFPLNPENKYISPIKYLCINMRSEFSFGLEKILISPPYIIFITSYIHQLIISSYLKKNKNHFPLPFSIYIQKQMEKNLVQKSSSLHKEFSILLHISSYFSAYKFFLNQIDLVQYHPLKGMYHVLKLRIINY